MTDVLVATESRFVIPELQTENESILRSLRAVGLEARQADWHDSDVNWRDCRTVLIRTTWDYPDHIVEFLRWVDRVESAGTPLCNSAQTVRWNHDKGYLIDLETAGVPIVPARLVSVGQTVHATNHRLVLKPAIGAGSARARLVEPGDSVTATERSIVNPFLPEIDRGELSVFVIDGNPVLCVRKTPSATDWRVQSHWGGRSRVEAEINKEAAQLSLSVLNVVSARWPGELPPLYLRIDLIESDSGWRVLEVEAIEPSFYCDLTPVVAEALAAALARRMAEAA